MKLLSRSKTVNYKIFKLNFPIGSLPNKLIKILMSNFKNYTNKFNNLIIFILVKKNLKYKNFYYN